MIRTLSRNLICFCAAVVLLALMVCALEVSLRSWRLRSNLHSGRRVRPLEELIAPHEMSWIDVRPLVNFKREISSGRSVRIQTNEYGIRGASVTLPKPRGVYRILCLGGDNVFGSTLSVQETIPDRLQRILDQHAGIQVEILNAGCPRAGPLINLLRYRSHLAALQPDLVIFCLNEDDLSFDRDVRGALHLDPSRNPAFASHPGLRGQGSAFMDRVCEEFITVDWLLGWAGNVAGAGVESTVVNTAPVRGSIQRDLAAMVPLSTLVSGNYGNLLISVSPSAWGVDRARNSMDKSQSSFAEDVRRFLKEAHLVEKIQVHDGLAAFLAPDDARLAFSPETGSLTPEGNDLYAQQLARFLLQTVPGLSGPSATSQPPPAQVPANPLGSAVIPAQQPQQQPRQHPDLHQSLSSPPRVLR